MFRPVPTTPGLGWIPFRLIAFVILVLALVLAAVLLFGLERQQLLLRDFSQGQPVPTELFAALWQSRRDLIFMTLLVFLVGAVGIGTVITFVHYNSTRRTLEEVKGLARNILQSIPTGILTLSPSGVITAVNPTAEAVLKRSSLDLLGHAYESVFTEGDLMRVGVGQRITDSPARQPGRPLVSRRGPGTTHHQGHDRRTHRRRRTIGGHHFASAGRDGVAGDGTTRASGRKTHGLAYLVCRGRA